MTLFAPFQLWVRVLAVWIFLALLSSCAAGPERTLSPVPEQTSFKIVQTLQEREAKVVSLKGLFQAEIDGKGMPFAQSLQGSIFYQRPDHYRIKGFSRFGGLVFDFLLAGEWYALRVQDHPKPIVGGMDNFQRLGELRLPVLLSLRAIEVLLGKLPLGSEGFVAVQANDGVYQFDIPPNPSTSASTFIQRLLIEEGSLQIRQLEFLHPDGESVVSIQASDFRPVRASGTGDVDFHIFPFTVVAEDRIQAGKISLEFQEMKANVAIDERLFAVPSF
ncbi:MAG: hypothetical protein O2999_12855 [Nitrospirae bacterium]|nr:hypothetical protein [Nitrospirota bacterium]MDA1305163.1 hypothetical protein [Nitrospirota bacterium]